MKIIRLFLINFLAIANMIQGYSQSVRDSVIVTMETEEGNLRIVLFTREAPVTCANFLRYVEQLGDQGGEFYRTVTMANQPSLDFGGQRNPDGQGFAAFGQVLQGMDVVRKIQVRPAEGQALTPPVRILRIVKR